MRKFILIVVALVFGAGVGIGSSELWARGRVLPYCKVANNAESYHMRFIRVKAKVQFGYGGMSIYEDCDPDEALASSIDFENGDPHPLSGSAQMKTADAIVEGEFDAHHSTGCWGPKFHIFASKVELTSSVADYVPKD